MRNGITGSNPLVMHRFSSRIKAKCSQRASSPFEGGARSRESPAARKETRHSKKRACSQTRQLVALVIGPKRM